MRSALALLILAAGLVSASAQQPPRATVNALAGSCASVAQATSSHGVVVLKTGRGSGPWDYQRVVRDSSFCFLRQDTAPLWVETRDNAQCFAGYVCEESRQGRIH